MYGIHDPDAARRVHGPPMPLRSLCDGAIRGFTFCAEIMYHSGCLEYENIDALGDSRLTRGLATVNFYINLCNT